MGVDDFSVADFVWETSDHSAFVRDNREEVISYYKEIQRQFAIPKGILSDSNGPDPRDVRNHSTMVECSEEMFA